MFGKIKSFLDDNPHLVSGAIAGGVLGLCFGYRVAIGIMAAIFLQVLWSSL